MSANVQQFDPVARASELARDLPRRWSGSYQPFGPGSSAAVTLQLASVTALGQMVDVRGEMTLGSTTIPVQGNLNAQSDQLDLLLLGDYSASDLQFGGEFLGLQGFNLSGWMAPRFTHPGGQLELTAVVPVVPTPAPPARARVIRGLWKAAGGLLRPSSP